MNAVTKAVELTEFQTVVLAAMRNGGGFGTSREIAELAGFKPEPVRACLAKLSDRGLTYAEPSLKKGEPPTWYLAETATPSPSANDGTPGDDEPAPEPGDTQAVDAAEAAPDPGGWIPWRGGECPVPEGVACWVRFRGGMVDICHAPKLLFWGRGIDEDNEDDIVAYRLDGQPVAQTPAQNPDGWIPWHGGECPVPVGSRCSIRIRCADAAKCVRNPEAWWWGRREDCQAGDGDIIAYRPEPKQTGPASFDDPDDYGDDEIPAAAPGPDGWIPWNGGECPVPDGVTCWVRFRDGSVVFQDNPFDLIWANCNDPCDIVAYRLDTPKYAIIAGYLDAVAAESAADSAPLTGDDVCSADAVIAEWKREHAPAAPTVAPADPFAVWLADTPAGCAGQRAIDAAEQEAARLRAEAAEMVREAEEALEFGMIVAEIIQFADQRNANTSTSEEEFGLAELLAAAYEAVAGKRVA